MWVGLGEWFGGVVDRERLAPVEGVFVGLVCGVWCGGLPMSCLGLVVVDVSATRRERKERE